MFFVVLWEVVSPLRAIFDIMTQNRENRKKRVQKWPYLSPFEAFLKVKYSKNQGDDFEWFFKVVLMVPELYPGYGKVSWGLKESIPNLRTCFWLLKMRLRCSFFETSISKNTPKNTYKTRYTKHKPKHKFRTVNFAPRFGSSQQTDAGFERISQRAFKPAQYYFEMLISKI